jgi:hypothetical protein
VYALSAFLQRRGWTADEARRMTPEQWVIVAGEAGVKKPPSIEAALMVVQTLESTHALEAIRPLEVAR